MTTSWPTRTSLKRDDNSSRFRTRGFVSAITGRLFAAGSYEGSFKGELETFRTIAERESALADAGGSSGG